MKKKMIAILMGAAMVLSLAACGDSDVVTDVISVPEEETTSTQTETSVESTTETVSETAEESSLTDAEVKEIMLEEDYEPILMEYYNAVNYRAEPFDNDLYSMYSEANYFDDTMKEKCGYCFYDVDGDGNLELILGMGNTLYGLANDSEGAVNLLAGAGYRTFLGIFTDGTVVLEGSSGAACYSYDFYTYDGEKLILQDFYYSDWADNEAGIAYYHNTTGEWTDAEDEEITQEEFEAIAPKEEDKVDFSTMLTPLSSLDERFPQVNTNITLDDLDATGVTWVLSYSQDLYEKHLAETDEVVQTIIFNEDGTAEFYRNEDGDEVGATGLEVDYSGKPYFFVSDNDSNYNITVIGFLEDGTLMVQRTTWNVDTCMDVVINEFYVASVG